MKQGYFKAKYAVLLFKLTLFKRGTNPPQRVDFLELNSTMTLNTDYVIDPYKVWNF